VRNIYPGEEILINCKHPYHTPLHHHPLTTPPDTDSEYTWDERQAATMVSWGFACQCSVCRQPKLHVAASDKRLRMIKALKGLLNDWTEDKPDRAQMAELMVTLYEQERLDVPIAQAYEAAAYAYSVVGDEFATMTWASKAVEAMTILYGGEHPLTQDLEVLMLNPSEHRTWLYKVPSGVEEDDEKKSAEKTASSTSSASASKSEGAGLWKYF
jgi:hypothetical protein